MVFAWLKLLKAVKMLFPHAKTYGPRKQPFYCDGCGETITEKQRTMFENDGIPYHVSCFDLSTK